MDLVANAPTSLVPTGGGGIIAFVQAVLQQFLHPDLTSEERMLLEGLRSASCEVGPYVLGASDREDILVRIDAVLDDPAYYERFLATLLGVAHAKHVKEGIAATEQVLADDLFADVFGRFLGPASLPHLRDIQRGTALFAQWFQAVASLVPPEEVSDAVEDLAREPLVFVSAPTVPVPVARALLAQFRNDVFTLVAFAPVFEQRSVEPWLGLAFAELWSATLREALVLPASISRDLVPLDVVPYEKELHLNELRDALSLTNQAYMLFNADAERSGESLYPPAP